MIVFVMLNVLVLLYQLSYNMSTVYSNYTTWKVGHTHEYIV